MAKALNEGFKILLHFNHDNFDVKEDGVLIFNQSEDMNIDNVAVTRNNVYNDVIEVQPLCWIQHQSPIISVSLHI